jgi:hypothetical protein
VTEEPKPVGSGRFRDHAQDSYRVLGMSFPTPLLAMKRVVWHTLTGDHDGEKGALLAQLRLPLATRSKRISPDKSILSPPLSHSPMLLLKEYMSQVASTS